MLFNTLSCTGQFPKEGKKELLASTSTKKLSFRATPKDRKQRASIKKPTKKDGEMAYFVRCLVYEREDRLLIPRTHLERVDVVAGISALGRWGQQGPGTH